MRPLDLQTFFPRPNIFPVPLSLPAQGSQPDTETSIIEALVCETHVSALQAATVTSAINALRQPDRLEDPREITKFVPYSPSILLAARAVMFDAGIAAETIEDVELFFEEVRPARLQLERLFVDAEKIGLLRAEVLHRSQLVSAWQIACRGAIKAVRSLDHALRYSVPERYTESVPVLVSLLNSAAQGLQPCVGPGGRPFMPELPQRRRSARKGLYQECTAAHGRRKIRALVTDISMGGLGLDGVPGLHAYDTVIVDLDSGRRLMGSVVWAKERRAGLRFSTPLPPNDPLLFG
jgi:hypothetical protein